MRESYEFKHSKKSHYSIARPTKEILRDCARLRKAYEQGLLGNMKMPEDARPQFSKRDIEKRLAYFTLPMSLNYQRNSYALWEAATKTYLDPETSDVFSVVKSAAMPASELREKLVRHKVALQPNKHIDTWQRLAQVFVEKWGSIEAFLCSCDNDFQSIRAAIQVQHKKNFPYLSGPKIFHYWSYILVEYCEVNLKNRQQIEIAPDTHVLQASVKLGVLRPSEAEKLSRDEVSQRWRELLAESKLSPIDMHSPLWFWSRNSFQYKI